MEKLRLSAPDWCFFNSGMDPADYYKKLAKIGYEAVEMVDPARRATARTAGLEIINHSGPGMTQGLNDPANHPALLAQIRKSLTDAKADAIPAVIVFSGNRGSLSAAEGLSHCVTGLSQLVPEAEKLGVDLIFEMLNSYNHQDYQADHSAFGFELKKALPSGRFKILYDIYHMSRMGEDVLADLLAHRADITHIHVAETPDRGKPVAQGQVDYARLVKGFHGAGYRGYWGMEFVPKDDPFKELAQAFELFQSYVR